MFKTSRICGNYIFIILSVYILSSASLHAANSVNPQPGHSDAVLEGAIVKKGLFSSLRKMVHNFGRKEQRIPALKPLGLDDFPKDIKIVILNFCDVFTLHNIALLAKNWHEVFGDSAIYIWEIRAGEIFPYMDFDLDSGESFKSQIKEHKYSTKMAVKNPRKRREPWHVAKISGLDHLKWSVELNDQRHFKEALDHLLGQSSAILELAEALYSAGRHADALHFDKIYYETLKRQGLDDFRLLNSVKKNDFNRSKHLLEAGANPEVADRSGWTAMMVACAKGLDRLVVLLIEHKAKVSQAAFNLAMPNLNLGVLQAIFISGININSRDSENGSTALMFATQQGEWQIAEFLLENGAGLSFISRRVNKTAFDFAMEKVSKNTLMVLFNNGLDIDTRDSEYGSTALMFAAQQGNKEAVLFLLEKKADKSLKSQTSNKTAFDFANTAEIKEILQR